VEEPRSSHVRAQATYLIYRGLGTAMQKLPESVAGGAASVVGLALTTVRRDARVAYGRNLRRVLGSGLSDTEVRAWTRRAFLNYAQYWLEGARLPAIDPEVVRARMSVPSGYEHLETAMAAGKGAILALPHLGRWEWGGAWLSLHGYPMTAVAEPVDPPELYDWFVSQRQRLGLTIVPLGDAGGALLRTLRGGGLVGLLCDRDIVGNGVEVEFFGERTTLPAGPATLALRTGAALLPAAVYGGPGRRYHTGVILPPVEAVRTGRLRADVTRLTQQVARDLESLIRRAPDQWYLFQPNWPSDRPDAPASDSSPATDDET
jgi:lauroyl/myristoyl acyltransferase